MNKKRPMNLDLRSIQFPLTAIGSILHRISGFILFFFVPLLLWGLQTSLKSQTSFDSLSHYLANPWLAFVVWGFVAALIYHLLAGIRHLLMDIGIGETLRGARGGVICVLVFSVVLIILVGVWLW